LKQTGHLELRSGRLAIAGDERYDCVDFRSVAEVQFAGDEPDDVYLGVALMLPTRESVHLVSRFESINDYVLELQDTRGQKGDFKFRSSRVEQYGLLQGSLGFGVWGPFMLPVAVVTDWVETEATKKNTDGIFTHIIEPMIRALPTTLRRVWYVSGKRAVGERDQNRHSTDTPRFDHAYAAVLANAESRVVPAKLADVSAAMGTMGLTNKVTAKVIDAGSVLVEVAGEVTTASQVERMFNLALVGLGVSAALPVVTVLIHAQENQTVIIEEPEMHLHPKGQAAMADLIVAAAKRGVRVIVETHGDIMLLRMQTLLAKGQLKPGDSVFHWFGKNAQGATEVQSVFPDAAGRVGAWLNDFATVRAHTNDDYLDASFERLTGEPPAVQHE